MVVGKQHKGVKEQLSYLLPSDFPDGSRAAVTREGSGAAVFLGDCETGLEHVGGGSVQRRNLRIVRTLLLTKKFQRAWWKDFWVNKRWDFG